jgi:hypothetical protein
VDAGPVLAIAIIGLAAAPATEPPPAWRGCEGETCWAVADGTVARSGPGGRIEERRPAFLAGARVDAAAVYGDSLWLGLSTPGGEPLGLVRYDWTRRAPQVFRGADTGPCGFFVLDVAVRDGTLWVTTDLGVSRLALAAEWDEWTHFRAAPFGLEETACATLLAAAIEEAGDAAAVRRHVAAFRPRFWKRYQRRR